MIEKIGSKAFIKLSDVPEHLGHAELDEDSKSKSKHRPVSSITQWLQCFAVYTAVISKATTSGDGSDGIPNFNHRGLP